MAHTQQLNNMLIAAEDLVHNWLITDGHQSLMPMYHLVTGPGEKDIVIGCPWDSPITKKIMFAEVKRKAREINAIAAVFVSEAWAVSRKTIEEMVDADPPSQQPDRMEIVFAIATDGEEHISRSWKIVRAYPGGPISALTPDDMHKGDLSGGLLDGLLHD